MSIDHEPPPQWSVFSSAPPPPELHFHPPAFFPSGVRWTLAIVAGLMLALGREPWDALAEYLSGSDQRLLIARWIGIGLCAATALALLWRAKARPRSVPPIVPGESSLVVPRSAGSSKTHEIPYQELVSLEVIGGTLVIGTRHHVLAYPLHLMREPDRVRELLTTVRERLYAAPAGHGLLEGITRREALGRTLRARPVKVMRVILGMLAVAYVIEQFFGAPEDMLELLRLGANAPALSRSGQFFRLFAANFLHGHIVHLFLNCIALLALGLTLERIIGPWRFTLVYLASALGGSVASMLLARAPLSVGASTAIFGLFGALAVVQWRVGMELPAGFRQPRSWWVFNLGINGLLTVLVPFIDMGAHLGGFVTGALVAALLRPSPQSIRAEERSTWVKGAACALSLAFAVALMQAAVHSSRPRYLDFEELGEALLGQSSAVSAEQLNEVTWLVAIDVDATPQALQLARRAGERAYELEPSPEIADSLATVYYRLGDFDRAIVLERIALGTGNDRIYVSQLARFLRARLQKLGPLTLGPGASAPGVRVSPAEAGGAGDFQLLVDGMFPNGALIWVLVKTNERLEGAGIIQLGPAGNAAQHYVAVNQPPKGEAERLTYQLALVDTTACGACAADASWRYQNIDRTVLDYP